jgi:hypothetical protein
MLYLKPDNNKAKTHFELYKQKLLDRINVLLLNQQSADLSDFLNNLLTKSNDEVGSLFELITASPSKMEEIINRLPSNFSIYKRPENTSLSEVFSIVYATDLDKVSHIDSVNIKTCPYCNQNFIAIDQNGKGKHEIDHYYPQSSFPFLAMSYFNLIPSCRSCNTMFGGKGKTIPIKKDTSPFEYKIFNPYDLQVKQMSFHLEINSIDDIWRNRFNIDIEPSEQGNEYENIFNLKSIYKHHNDFVQEIYLKSIYLYSDRHKEQLNNWLIERNINPNQIELYRFLYGFYDGEESFHLRPLSKMAADLLIDIEELVL